MTGLTNASDRREADNPRHPRYPDLTGVVLAGGLSSRLGHDKAVLRLEGGQNADLLARAAGLLDQLCGRCIVVGRVQPGYECYPDALPGRGPVGGIATALKIAASPCLVMSCDLPFMELPVLERLAEARAARPKDALSTSYRQADTGHIEALVAIYEPGALPFFEDCAESGKLKISLVVPPERRHFLTYEAGQSLPFFNINYPADLEAARRVMQVLGRV